MLHKDFLPKVDSDSTMAYPISMIEQEMRHFFYQWRLGLQPSLTMYTQYNGSITVSTCVTSFPPPPSKPSRASGRKARLRRKMKRAASQTRCNVDRMPAVSKLTSQDFLCKFYGFLRVGGFSRRFKC